MLVGKGTILVTGAAGFLGSHLCERFLRQGFSVIGVDNFSTGRRENILFLEKLSFELKSKFLFFEKDVVPSWDWALDLNTEWVHNLKYVFHFSSPASPRHFERLSLETIWANTQGLENSLQFANKHGAKLIFASTSEVYGDAQVHPQPEEYWGHVNPVGARACYNEAKRLGEAIVSCHNLREGTRHGIVRIFNTYGPRMNLQDGRVIVNFCYDALSKKSIEIFGDGNQTRSFCYVDDLMEALDIYAQKDLTEIINIGSDEEISIADLAKKVRGLFLETKIEIVQCPRAKDDPKRRRPDLSRAKSLLAGWQAQIGLDEGLKKMLHWMQT